MIAKTFYLQFGLNRITYRFVNRRNFERFRPQEFVWNDVRQIL